MNGDTVFLLAVIASMAAAIPLMWLLERLVDLTIRRR